MLELVSGGVIGTLLGGIFRLAPEVLRLLDRKNERKHELSMFDRQCNLESQRGAQKLEEINANHNMSVDEGVLSSFNAAINQQTEMVKAAGGWAAKASAAVRPLVTYWVWFLYSAAFCTLLWITWTAKHIKLFQCYSKFYNL